MRVNSYIKYSFFRTFGLMLVAIIPILNTTTIANLYMPGLAGSIMYLKPSGTRQARVIHNI